MDCTAYPSRTSIFQLHPTIKWHLSHLLDPLPASHLLPPSPSSPSNAPSHCQQSQHARLLTLLAAACASTAARALATLLAAPDIREHGLQGGSGKGRCGVDGRWPWLLLMLAFLVTSMTMPMAMGQCCLLQCSTEEVVA